MRYARTDARYALRRRELRLYGNAIAGRGYVTLRVEGTRFVLAKTDVFSTIQVNDTIWRSITMTGNRQPQSKNGKTRDTNDVN